MTVGAALPLLALLVLLPASADAALLKHDLNDFTLSQFSASSPPVSIAGPGESRAGVALIGAADSAPLLAKLLTTRDADGTTQVPQLSGFIWFSINVRQGPSGTFTGSGSTASSIAWGTVTGWTRTGGSFCNASPSFICDLAGASQLTTVAPTVHSSFYDLGTWIFHGTGFTSAGFVFFTSTLPGNAQLVIQGAFSPDATVPALPVLAVGALATGLLAMGLAALRGR